MNRQYVHIKSSERLNNMTEFIKKEIHFEGYNYLFVAFTNKGFDKEYNQDYFYLNNDTNSIIVCVADGLGSSKLSHRGAERAVVIMSDVLQNIENFDDLASTFKDKWKDIIHNDYSLYDTTIKFFQLRKDCIYYGGIGDGLTIFKHDSHFTKSHNTNSFTNQTESINSPSYVQEFKQNTSLNCNFEGLMMATDGISEDIDENQIENMLNQVIKQLQNDVDNFVNNMIELINEWPVKTNHDDKTIVFLIKRGAENSG